MAQASAGQSARKTGEDDCGADAILEEILAYFLKTPSWLSPSGEMI